MKFLEVYVLPGKRLQGARLTVEGYWRIIELVQLVNERRRRDVDLVIVFSGYKGEGDLSEAKIFEHHFKAFFYNEGLRWGGDIIREEMAVDTPQNVRNAITKVREKHAKEAAYFTRVYIVSTDYHIERIWAVDEHLPELSQLRVLRKEEGCDIVGVKAPYVYPTSGLGQQSWLAGGYLVMQRLSLLKLNLLGIAGNEDKGDKDREREGDIKWLTVDSLRDAPFQTLVHAYNELTAMLTDPPLEGPFRAAIEKLSGPQRDPVPDDSINIREAIKLAESLIGEFRPRINKPIADNEEEKRLWIGFRKALDRIRIPFDPDAPF